MLFCSFHLMHWDEVVMPLTGLQLPIPLSVGRARFMLTLLKARRDYLLRALAP